MREIFCAAGAVLLALASATNAEATTVRGTVRDKNGSPGGPVASVPVLFWQHGGAWQATVSTGPDGYFEQDCPAGATYNIACNKPGEPGVHSDLLSFTQDNVVVGSAALVVNFDLGASTTLVLGTVRDKAGRAVASVPVLFWQHGGAWQATVESGPDGHFEQTCPAGAVYNIACNKRGLPGARPDLESVETVDVSVGQARRIVNFDLALVGAPPAAGIGIDAQGQARAPILAEYAALGAARVGTPRDNGGGAQVHRWGPGWIQDVTSGALMYRDGEVTAHWVQGAVWSAYLAYGGGEGRLGYPIGDDDGKKQAFEHGSLVFSGGRWVPAGAGPLPLTAMAVDGNAIFRPDGSLDLDPDAIAATGTRVVRVNWTRGPWSGPSDSALFQGRTWFQAVDQLVDSLGARGVAVYGLLNDELTTTDHEYLRDMRDPTSARAWIETFAGACEAAIGHLRDRVRVFEIVNEPNEWGGGSNPRVSAYWEALILKRVYERVRLAHPGDPAWQVTLVSGPLFTFSQESGADYLRSLYANGKSHHGWDDVRARSGSYPLDGIGAHLYLVQEASHGPADVAPAFKQRLDLLAGVVSAADPEASAKRFWLSEIGWESGNGGERHQADMLEATFNALGGDARVALGVWFCAHDFPGSTWGLVDSGHRKEAFDRFHAVATR